MGPALGRLAGERCGAGRLAVERRGAGRLAGERRGAGRLAGERRGAGRLAGERRGAGRLAGERRGAGRLAGERRGAGLAAAGCAVAIVRSRTRELRRARWLAFFQREKTLDKLCKSILDWKQEITQEAARDRRRRMGRDASTASGEQSSPSSPRGEGLGLAQNLPNEKTCMEGWLPCTFRVRWGFRRGGPGLTRPGLTQPGPDTAGACAGWGPCAKPGPPAGQLCWPWAG